LCHMRAPRKGPPFADLPGTDSDQTAIHGAGTVTANAACSTPVPSARCCFQAFAWLIWWCQTSRTTHSPVRRVVCLTTARNSFRRPSQLSSTRGLRAAFKKMRNLYARRRQWLVDALHQQFGVRLLINPEAGGMHLVAGLHEHRQCRPGIDGGASIGSNHLGL